MQKEMYRLVRSSLMFPVLIRYSGATVTTTKVEGMCVYIVPPTSGENMLYLRKFSSILVSSLTDTGDDWTEQEERSIMGI